MEIILIEKVRNLGVPGDIVSVKPGYARNFLIPTLKAMRATEGNKSAFEERKKEYEAENARKIKEAKSQISSIEGIFVSLIRQAGEDGRLFGSVTAKDIAEALNATSGSALEKRHINLVHSIKYLGIYEVEVILHAEVLTSIKLNVSRSDDEAAEAKKNFLSKSLKKETVEKLEAKNEEETTEEE